MARIRTIKPDLWTDAEFVECSSNARLLFVAALNFASDFGVLPDKPKQLKMQCFPADDIDIVPLITELIDHEFWVRTVAPDGANVLLIRTFSQHQKVDKPNKGRWGDPAEWGEIPRTLVEHSSNTPRTVDESSPPEGKGREGNIRATEPPERFDEFWAAYPRHEAKAAAIKAWRNLTSRDRDHALAALPLHAARWRRENPGTNKFVPHPATWINKRRWEDELTSPTPSTPQRATVELNGATLDARALQ